MPDYDVAEVVNGWQALFLFAVLVVPQLFGYLNSREAKSAARAAAGHAKDAADEIKHRSNPNSGGVAQGQPQLDRGAAGRAGAHARDLTYRMQTLERAAEKRRGRLTWRRSSAIGTHNLRVSHRGPL